MTGLRTLPAGPGALLVELDDAAAVPALAAAVERLRVTGELVADDVVPGARTVLIDGVDPAGRDALAGRLGTLAPAAGDAPAGAEVELPVVFDGPDLAEVAAHWGVDRREVAAIVTGARLRVAFCGFAPGFAYLAGLGRSVPRHASPRTAVPAGAVALAGEYAGVYPRSSPGGWQIVGTLAADAPPLWDLDRAHPALLEPGTRVRFVDAGSGA